LILAISFKNSFAVMTASAISKILLSPGTLLIALISDQLKPPIMVTANLSFLNFISLYSFNTVQTIFPNTLSSIV
jgi:hypothetical protein